jgi:hypothetical protein
MKVNNDLDLGDSLKGHCVIVEASYAGDQFFTDTEEKLLRLGLDQAATVGEIRNSASKFF